MTAPAVLQHSPLDAGHPVFTGDFVQLARASKRAWVASRYNARAADENGQMVVWNTMTGAISVFPPEQRVVVERLISRVGFEGELTPLGKYLFDRGFIVGKDVDEAKRFQLTFGQQHYRTDTLELILMPSEDCNFRCVYCYEDFARGTMLPSVRTGIKRYVESRAAGLRALSIGWFGGEPLYGFEAIADLAPFLLETARSRDIQYSSHMTTNGYLLTPEWADQLLAWEIRDFQITLDGLPEHHDARRVARDGSPTFATIFSNLVALQRRDEEFQVRLRTNFDASSAPGLAEYVDLIASEFAGDERFTLALHAVGRWGGPNDASLEVCGTQESRLVQQNVRRRARERNLNVGRGLKDMNRPGRAVCYAARPYNFLIGADGKVMKCTVVLDKQPNNIVGRLTEDGELILNADHFALWVDPAWQRDSTCSSCYLVPVCQGLACPLVRINDGQRPCPSTKSAIKAELLETLDLTRPAAREVQVAAR